MTDIALNSFGKPLSMTREAVRKRDYRARRDKQGANLSQAGPSRAVRDKPPKRNGQVVQFNGRHMSPAVTSKDNQMLNGQDMHVPPTLSHGVAPPLVPGQEIKPPSVPQVPQPVPSRRRVTFGRVIVTIIGLMFLVGDLGTSTTYLVGQGRELADMLTLGIIAVAYQLGLVVTPTLLGIFWREHWYGYVLFGVLFMLVSFAAAIYAATGFVNANFGDTQAGRAASIKQRAAYQADLDRAREKRNSLVFEDATQAQVDAARDALKNCTRRTDDDECKARRRKHADLLERLTKTEHAADLDKRVIPELQMKVASILAVKSSDPQIDGIVHTFDNYSVAISPKTAESWRLLIFIVLPLAAGLMFAWAEVLGERKKI